jgi:hypothetical protein
MTEELRRDVLLPLIVLMVIAVLTSAGAIALLARMAPAIEHIVSDNIFSLEAGEEMLGIVAAGTGDDDARARFNKALTRAEGNVTEAAEREHLREIRARGPAALAGDPAARRDVIAALSALSATNRDAIVRRDDDAKRIGYAGAWTAVLMGVLAFAWGLMAIRRARGRLIEPLREVRNVLNAARSGDRYRRCRHIAAPVEVERIMTGVDDLLDARALRHFADEPPLRAVNDRAILLHLLEGRAGPAWIVTAKGTVDAVNRAGLDALANDGAAELRASLESAASGAEQPGLRVEYIASAERWICERTDA